MLLRISEGERRAPRSAEDLPSIDAEVRAQRFHVPNEIPCRVLFEVRVGDAPSATSLIEENDSIATRIKEAALSRVCAAAGPSVYEHGGLAIRVARLFVVDRMGLRYLERALIIRFD